LGSHRSWRLRVIVFVILAQLARGILMTGSTHVVITIAATMAYSISAGHTPDFVSWITVVIGGLAPDIDAGGGTIARPGKLFGCLLPEWLVKLLDLAGLALSRGVRSLLGHRNATHWPVWAIILMLLGHHFGLAWLWWFGFGYLGHVLADFCTKSGVPLAGPFSTKAIRWSPLKTGGWSESVLATMLWGFILWQGGEMLAASVRHWLSYFSQTFLTFVSINLPFLNLG
jgi:hypothetical protein